MREFFSSHEGWFVMATLTETLERISDLLWQPLHIETYSMEDGMNDSGEERFESAIVFDIRDADEDSAMEMLEDLFGDGMPEGLDLAEKIPFALIGYPGLEEDDELEAGNLEAIAQPSYLLLADVDNGTANKVAVYKVDIDGTVMPDSMVKIAEDVADLKFLSGFYYE